MHVRQRWYVVLPLALAWVVGQHYLLFNWTRSLPYSVVWLERTQVIARGDLIVYRFEGVELAYLKHGQRFFKRIAGVPGDRITVRDRHVFVNDVAVGVAREHSVDGHRLEPVTPGVIAPDYYYAQGTHAMSFDSRYRESGLVHVHQISARHTSSSSPDRCHDHFTCCSPSRSP